MWPAKRSEGPPQRVLMTRRPLYRRGNPPEQPPDRFETPEPELGRLKDSRRSSGANPVSRCGDLLCRTDPNKPSLTPAFSRRMMSYGPGLSRIRTPHSLAMRAVRLMISGAEGRIMNILTR